jgi:hypothetical protein
MWFKELMMRVTACHRLRLKFRNCFWSPVIEMIALWHAVLCGRMFNSAE